MSRRQSKKEARQARRTRLRARLQAEVTSAALASKAAAAARDAKAAATAHEAASEEPHHARITEKLRRWAVKEMAKEQRRTVRAMAGQLSKEEKAEDGDESDISGSEQIHLDPLCVFDRYCRADDGKGKGKGKSGHG
jgi:hypothetical protein